MANILKFSKRPGDLLHEEGAKSKDMPVCPSNNLLAAKNLNDAPDANFVAVPHELLSSTDRRITLEGVVNERRNIGGTAQAEQLISELYSASQINRGPPGFCPSSRLHFDMLIGRDDQIGFSDYLNFDRHQI